MIAERSITAGGVRTRVLEVDGPRAERPVLFVHGNPTSADDWRPFLERLEGRRRCLAPDLPSWGKSERSEGLHHTIEDLAWFVERFVQASNLERFDLVMHDWGSVALVFASRWPESVGGLVVLDAVPLTADYRWHWIARLWRRPVIGELLNATTTRLGTRMLLRQATPRPGSLDALADQIHEQMDAGTKSAILELYRDADPERLEAAGRDLATLRCRALVVWGDRDPYIAPEFADWFARALGGEAQVEHVANAGHWPWLDEPEVLQVVADFLAV